MSQGLIAWSLLAGLTALVVGCGGGLDTRPPGGGGSDAAATDAGGMRTDSGTWIPPGGSDAGGLPSVCDEQHFDPERIGDPDIMIIMDMSSSMLDGTPSKYEQTAGAVSAVVTALETAATPIQWGLILFPSDGDCAVKNQPDVPIQAGNAASISTKLTSTTPLGNTPAHKAVDLARAYYGGLNDGRAHYNLIATDGQPNCVPPPFIPKPCFGPGGCAATEYCDLSAGSPGVCLPDLPINSIVQANQAGIKTYVVGIDIDNTSSPRLDEMAQAGGTARPTSPMYYPVADQASLETALRNIANEIISCTFQLSSPPLDIDYVVVTIAGAPVARDTSHVNGWDYDPDTLTLYFYGQACQELQANPQTVSVTYGCPPPG